MAETERDRRSVSRTGLVYDPDYLRHEVPPGHPERSERLVAIVDHLKRTGVCDRLEDLPPDPADVSWIQTVHSEEYITTVENVCRQGGGLLDTADTPTCTDSYEVARLAVGGVLGAVDAVVARRVKNAFCLVRPPGHHARPSRGMGFCVFNNIAVAARYAQKKHGIDRVLIVDWDVHHGNGTQEVFYEDPSVLFVSVHRYPFYPFTGSIDERGAGPGAGATINVPLPGGTDGATFVEAVRRALPESVLEAFRPGIVLVSAGFDAHRDDPLGGMLLEDSDYATLARFVRGIAERFCEGRLVVVLEGGYDLEAQARCAKQVFDVLGE